MVAGIGVANTWAKPSNGLLTGQSFALVASFCGAVAGLLWWRRRAPRLVAAALVIAHVIAFTPTALAVALYTVGDECHSSPRTLWGFGLAGCAADLVAVQGGGTAWDLRETTYTLAAVIGPLVVGYAVALRRELAASASSRLSALERSQQLLVEQARETERRRIAREMHDVVSHRIGHIVLAAGALQTARGLDSTQVVERAELIRAEGRAALEELREVLGVLSPNRTGEPAPRAPQPDAGGLPDLVERARTAGQAVDYEVHGHPEVLPTVIQQALFRTVQEALTNAAKHAPGAAVAVRLRCAADGVRLTVTNDAAARPPEPALPGGGNGLVGLRERAALLGGGAQAGPHGDGFRVTVHLPVRPLTA